MFVSWLSILRLHSFLTEVFAEARCTTVRTSSRRLTVSMGMNFLGAYALKILTELLQEIASERCQLHRFVELDEFEGKHWIPSGGSAKIHPSPAL